MLIIKPPKEKEDEVAAKEDKKKKNVLDFNELDENQLDKNCLDEVCEGQEEGGFTSLDINPLDVDYLLNVLTELNKKYQKKRVIISNQDGRVAGYNPDTLVTTLIDGDEITLMRQYESSIIDITIDRVEGHKINIDQYGSIVPEIYTNEAGFNSTIDITIK